MRKHHLPPRERHDVKRRGLLIGDPARERGHARVSCAPRLALRQSDRARDILLPIDTDGDGTPDFEDDDPVSPPVDVVQCASAPAPSPPPAPPPAPPPPPALPPKHCNTVVLEGGLDMCFGTPLFKGFVSDEAACALLCEAHALCHFYSAFSTGWCRLTASCGLAEVDSDGDGIPDSSDPDSTVDWVNVKSCGAPPSAPMPPLAPLL